MLGRPRPTRGARRGRAGPGRGRPGPLRQSRRAGPPVPRPHPASGSPGMPAETGGRTQARGQRGWSASQRAGAGPGSAGSAGLPVLPSGERPGWTVRAGTGASPACAAAVCRQIREAAACRSGAGVRAERPAKAAGPGAGGTGRPGAFRPPAGPREPVQPGPAGPLSAPSEALGINPV